MSGLVFCVFPLSILLLIFCLFFLCHFFPEFSTTLIYVQQTVIPPTWNNYRALTICFLFFAFLVVFRLYVFTGCSRCVLGEAFSPANPTAAITTSETQQIWLLLTTDVTFLRYLCRKLTCNEKNMKYAYIVCKHLIWVSLLFLIYCFSLFPFNWLPKKPQKSLISIKPIKNHIPLLLLPTAKLLCWRIITQLICQLLTTTKITSNMYMTMYLIWNARQCFAKQQQLLLPQTHKMWQLLCASMPKNTRDRIWIWTMSRWERQRSSCKWTIQVQCKPKIWMCLKRPHPRTDQKKT